MSVDKIETDLVVLGAGPGGYAAAFRAADHGLKVMLVDTEANPGGVCLYKGCIPSKALLHAAKVVNEARHAKEFGIEFSEPKVDAAKLFSWKNEVVKKLTGGLGQLTKQRKIEFIQGQGSFLNSKTLQVAKAHGGIVEVNFKNIIIATGSRPHTLPGWPYESENILNSTGALSLGQIPPTLLVVGGGYIGLELGSVYAALGTKVTVVEALDSILAGADSDLVLPLKRKLDSEMEIILKTKVGFVKESGDGVTVSLDGAEGVKERTFHKVLVSIGRKPNSTGLGLENTQVKVSSKGFIEIKPNRETDEPGVYAIGDVAGDPMLAHKASHEGFAAVESILGEVSVFEPKAIPAVVFTDPEIAWCGLTESDAKAKGIEVEIARFPWAASGRATSLGRSDGVTKLIVDPKTELVLGMGLCGPGAGELIAEGVLAIEMGATVSDLALTIHPHPTLSETVMEASEVFFGHATHLYRPKRK
ncbi:dihydrolipoyl dehydrogenase [bacterium]|nr:dihydrolipoyl dehydrogenase [bacterium]